MKVSTDACIQGAWTPVIFDSRTILDIGAGTGLLSLMLAQRFPEISIDAIEMDGASSNQAKANFNDSKWKERLKLIEGDATIFLFHKKYDLIICNPPFFQNSLLGNKVQRNTARHQITLSLEGLFNIVEANLTDVGYASIMLPVSEHEHWERILMNNEWGIFHCLEIVSMDGNKANRIVSLCKKGDINEVIAEQLIIYKERGVYTEGYINLLSSFYL